MKRPACSDLPSASSITLNAHGKWFTLPRLKCARDDNKVNKLYKVSAVLQCGDKTLASSDHTHTTNTCSTHWFRLCSQSHTNILITLFSMHALHTIWKLCISAWMTYYTAAYTTIPYCNAHCTANEVCCFLHWFWLCSQMHTNILITLFSMHAVHTIWTLCISAWITS